MKVLKKALSILLAASCAFSALAMSASAAVHPDPPEKLSVQLEAIRSYGEAGFTDVANDWSLPVITTCYELGLMSGRGAGKFDPSGTVSIAEAVTVTARIHELSAGGDGMLPESQPWYQSAVDYALGNGLISKGQFSSYTAAATRAELAGLLANVLPAEDYAPINEITELPDVSAATPYSKDIFKLYNAGVVTGSDVYGSFAPLSSITRAELSAMLCRLVQPAARKAVDLKVKPEGEAMAYTSDKILWLDSYPVAGLVEIEGELYCPVDYLLGRRVSEYLDMDPPFYAYVYDDVIDLSLATRDLEKSVPVPVLSSAARIQLGTSRGTDMELRIASGSGRVFIEKAVRTLGDNYYLIKLSALPEEYGYSITGDGVKILEGQIEKLAVSYEADLVGQTLPSLMRSTQRETVRAIHDYIVNHLQYDMTVYDKPASAAQSAAVAAAEAAYKNKVNITMASGYGVCEDYTHLFQAFCQRAGIPCRFVAGSTGGMGGHAWNKVFVDGAWYYVDSTWDDPVGGTPWNKYLFIDADTLAVDHFWSGDDFPMSGEYDPSWEQLDCNNITSRDMYRKCLVAQLMQGNNKFTLRVTSPNAYGGEMCSYLFHGGWWSLSVSHNGNYYTYTVGW